MDYDALYISYDLDHQESLKLKFDTFLCASRFIKARMLEFGDEVFFLGYFWWNYLHLITNEDNRHESHAKALNCERDLSYQILWIILVVSLNFDFSACVLNCLG